MTHPDEDVQFSDKVLPMREYQRRAAKHALEQSDMILGDAAEALRITRQTLAKLLNEQGFDTKAIAHMKRIQRQSKNRAALTALLYSTGGSITEAATALRIPRSQLRNRLSTAGVDVAAIRAKFDTPAR